MAIKYINKYVIHVWFSEGRIVSGTVYVSVIRRNANGKSEMAYNQPTVQEMASNRLQREWLVIACKGSGL